MKRSTIATSYVLHRISYLLMMTSC